MNNIGTAPNIGRNKSHISRYLRSLMKSLASFTGINMRIICVMLLAGGLTFSGTTALADNHNTPAAAPANTPAAAPANTPTAAPASAHDAPADTAVPTDNHDTNEPATRVAENGEDEETLTLNFRNVDISQFIESVSALTGRNFLVDRRVTGRITIIAARPIPRSSLYDVMLSVLQFYGFTAIPDGDITKVIPFAEGVTLPASAVDVERHGFITEVIQVSNILPAEVIAGVKPMLTRQAQIRALGKTNNIVISDTRASIERAKTMIARLDVAELDDYEIIPINNAEVGTVIATVNSLFKANNQALSLNLQADKRTNRLIISGSREVRNRIKEVVRALDIPLSSNANIKVIYLRYADAQNLANILTRLTSSEAFEALAAAGDDKQPQAQAARPAPQNQQNQQQRAQAQAKTKQEASAASVKSGIQADVGLNALIVSGTANFISAVEGIIRQLDIQKAQIIVEVIIAELTDELRREMGIDWVTTGSAGAFSADLSGNLGGVLTGVDNAARLRSLTGIGENAVIAGGFGGTVENGWAGLLRLLERDTRSNIIATPYLVTLDNEEATFTVGENRPFITGSVVSTDNGATTNTIERRNVGITLVVTPQVTAGDTVKVTINQEISNVLPATTADPEHIVTTERKITTSVQVRDGGLIVLGGLLRSVQSELGNKIPGLGDVPFLGALFKNQRSTVESSNIMLFMRPRVLKDEASIAAVSHGKYNNLRQQQLSLPQYSSLISKGSFPKLQSLSRSALFTDYGKQPTIENLLEPVDNN